MTSTFFRVCAQEGELIPEILPSQCQSTQVLIYLGRYPTTPLTILYGAMILRCSSYVNILAGISVFEMEHGHWVDEQNRQVRELRNALNAHLNDVELRVLVENGMKHYFELFRMKAVAAKEDVFYIMCGLWKTSSERFFLWIGGFRPSELLKVIPWKKNYPVISLLSLPNDLKASNSETSQLNFNPRSGRLGKFLWLPIDLKAWWLCWWRFGFTLYIYLVLTGIGVMPLQVLVPQLHPLADQQFVDVCNLRQSCQQAEDALSQGMDKLQQNLAETVAFGHMGDGAFLPPMAQAVEKLEALVSFVNQVVPPVTPTCVFTRELFNQDETSNICLRTVIRLIIFGKRLCCRCLES